MPVWQGQSALTPDSHFSSSCYCPPYNLLSLPSCRPNGKSMVWMPSWRFTKGLSSKAPDLIRARDGQKKEEGRSCPEADAQTVSMCLAWAGWLAGLRDSLAALVLPLSVLSLFHEVAGSLSSLHPIQPSCLVFISGRESPCPSFEATASTTCLFSPSRRHFCSECCLLLAPSVSAWSSCWLGSKYTSGVMGVWNS